jgi:hypothetical protein
MMNLLATNTMFGLVPFEGTWLTISIVIAIIGLIILGYFYDFDDDGPLIILEGFIVVTVSIFWGFILVFAVGVAVVALPIYIGFYVRKLKRRRDEKKKEKLEFMDNIEKMKKSRS